MAKMFKNQFVELAAELRATRPSGENKFATTKARHVALGRMQQWEEMVKTVADFCRGQNGSFDRGRFLAACGLAE